jgi:hypothetical protein
VPPLDFVGRVESFEADFLAMLAALGAPLGAAERARDAAAWAPLARDVRDGRFARRGGSLLEVLHR